MPAVGDLLAQRYRIDGVLGAGGMASVYLATDLRLERSVAVKVLLPNLARDPGLAERFEREARLLAMVTHPTIAEVFDVEPGDPATGREPFYVMELCEGGTLADRIEAFGALEPGEVVPLILAVAAALGELHRHGLVHRDVKPANILFTGGRPKLADFGLAKHGAPAGHETLTQPGTAMGTPAFMAPELVRGEPATVASDVYALAATTFNALTGRAPRPGDSLTALVASGAQDLPSVSTLSPRLGNAFDAVLGAGLASDPAARPSLDAFNTGLVAAQARFGGAEAAAVAAPSVDPMAATVRISVPRPEGDLAAARRIPDLPRRGRRRGRVHVGPATILVGALLAVPAVVVLWAATGNAAPTATASPSTPAGASPSPSSPAPSPTAAPSSTPSPGPTPTLSPLGAYDAVVAAIDRVRGGPEGLSGNDARELLDLAQKVRSNIVDEDFDDARADAERLLKEAREKAKHLPDDDAALLVGAVEDLLAAISP